MILFKQFILLSVLISGFNIPVFASTVEELKAQCDDGDGWSCTRLGFVYEYGIKEREREVKQNHFKAMEFYQKSCGLDGSVGCFSLAAMYHSQATRYYGMACDLKLQAACDNLPKK